MSIVRYRRLDNDQPHLGWLENERITPFPEDSGFSTPGELLQHRLADITGFLEKVGTWNTEPLDFTSVPLLAPIDSQEVWAAGVTYRRSRDARMEESTQQDVYDRVYDAERPELFFKATARRVLGPEGTIMIRGDSTWDVPEPELALVFNRHREVVGYTVGNDVSSRSIEGENPLYLPQAKTYMGSAALGPVIAMRHEVDNPQNLAITVVIERNNAEEFRGETSTAEMHRSLDELGSWLHRGNTFPDGAFLMTGTGIVPPDSFTLQDGDTVLISIEGIGTLSNRVARLDVDA
jgi:2-dehydro-3-deoxy-D-arabinonate dehydratase